VNGAVFALYTAVDIYDATGAGTPVIPANTEVERQMTGGDGEEGIARFHADLPLAMYYLLEIEAPKGYASTSKRIPVDATYMEDGRDVLVVLDENGELLQFENEQTKTVIDVRDDEEYEGSHALLKKTQIRLVDGDGNEVPVTRTNDGHMIAYGLEPGKSYTVIEDVPQYGYISNPLIVHNDYEPEYPDGKIMIGYDPHDITKLLIDSHEANTATFTALDKGGVQLVTVFNRRVTAELDVLKKGEVPKPDITDKILNGITYEVQGIPGAEYDLIAAENIEHPDGIRGIVATEGQLIVHLVTDSEGKAKAENLYIGKYELTETKAPFGYSRYLNAITRTVDLRQEYDAMKETGLFDIVLFGYDQWFNDGKLKLQCVSETMRGAVYRGWMMKPEDYERFYHLIN
jgi:hypothetical protein